MKFKDLEIGQRFWIKNHDFEGWVTKINPTIDPNFDNFTKWNARIEHPNNGYLSIHKWMEVEVEK